MQDFIAWVKGVNTGHKRVWLLLSLAWFVIAISLPVYYQVKSFLYCSSIIEGGELGVSISNDDRAFINSDSFAGCVWEKQVPVSTDLEPRRSYSNNSGQLDLSIPAPPIARYIVNGTKFNYSSGLKAVILGAVPPIIFPMVFYVLTRAYRWVREGYER